MKNDDFSLREYVNNETCHMYISVKSDFFLSFSFKVATFYCLTKLKLFMMSNQERKKKKRLFDCKQHQKISFLSLKMMRKVNIIILWFWCQSYESFSYLVFQYSRNWWWNSSLIINFFNIRIKVKFSTHALHFVDVGEKEKIFHVIFMHEKLLSSFFWIIKDIFQHVTLQLILENKIYNFKEHFWCL